MADSWAASKPVVHVIPLYPPSVGGAQKVAQSLVAAGRPAAPGLVLTSRDPRAPAGPARSSGVRRLRAVNLAGTTIMPGLAAALLRLPRGAVVHLHIISAVTPEIVYAAHVLRGTRYVAHLHFDIRTAATSWAGPVLRRIWMPLVLPRVLRAAAAVLVYTDCQRQLLASRYRVDPSRIFLTANGVDASFFGDGTKTLNVRPRILFVGRLAAEKNVPLLLDALAGACRQFDTAIVGSGPAERQLQRHAARLGLAGVTFHGQAEGEQLRSFYRAADIFVLPSASEGGMPLALLEALAMGVPAVAADLPAVRRLVRHGENGLLVPPGDPAAFRAALLQLAGDTARYQQMSAAARALGRQHGWQAVAGDLERVYDLARSPARQPGSGHRRTAGWPSEDRRVAEPGEPPHRAQ